MTTKTAKGTRIKSWVEDGASLLFWGAAVVGIGVDGVAAEEEDDADDDDPEGGRGGGGIKSSKYTVGKTTLPGIFLILMDTL